MLEFHCCVNKLDMSQLKKVYAESIAAAGRENYPRLVPNLQILEAEQDFYLFVQEFLHTDDAKIAVWTLEGTYKTALRLEKYADGFLLSGLETSQDARRKGYAYSLLHAVIQECKNLKQCKLYSHVRKSNRASIQLHEKTGFQVMKDYAEFIDDTVDANAVTFCIEL